MLAWFLLSAAAVTVTETPTLPASVDRAWIEYFDCVGLFSRAFSRQPEPAEVVSRAVEAQCLSFYRNYAQEVDWARDDLRRKGYGDEHLPAPPRPLEHDYVVAKVMTARALRK